MKKLYVPGRIWLDVNSFIKEFPQTTYSFYFLYFEGTYQDFTVEESRAQSTKPAGISETDWSKQKEWERDKARETHLDIIKFVLSPEYPLTLKVQVKLPDRLQVANALGMDKDCKNRWGKLPKGMIAIIAALRNQRANCYKVYKDRIINYVVSNGFRYFEAKSQSEYKQYNEVYA